MGNSQQLSLKQQQRLTQQQIEQIKMLEIPALEMEARVLQEINNNPALEYGKDPETEAQEDNEFNNQEVSDNSIDTPEEESDFENEEDTDIEALLGDDSLNDLDEDELATIQEYINDYDDRAADFGETQQRDRDEDSNKREPYSGTQMTSLQDYLKQQLADLDIDEEHELIGEYIIGNIDEDGYLRADLDTISDQISFQTSRDVSDHDMFHMLEAVQEFEPAGVAAKDLQECLLLQLERKNQTIEIQKAHEVLEKYFEDFSQHQYNRISRKMGMNEDDFNNVIKEITKLNPKPGNDWENSLINETGRQIMPDFLLENHDGKLTLTLNDTTIPDLHISPTYIRLLQEYKDCPQKKRTRSNREAAMFAKQKIEAANWFIEAIEQRQRTLLITMQAIVDHQQAFFLSGQEKKMRPMKLKDIAAATGLDISTISRVSNSKYVETEIGVFPLKYFFSESMATENGEEVSVIEVKTILKELVEAEDRKHPYTDEALVGLLQQKGYQIARRTVAKYREQLGIPTSRARISK